MNFIAVQKSPRQRQHFEVQYLTGRYIAMFLRSFMASELTGTLLYDFWTPILSISGLQPHNIETSAPVLLPLLSNV